MSKFMRLLLIVLFLGVIGYGMFRLWDVKNNYVQEQRVRDGMNTYRPEQPGSSANLLPGEKETTFVNQNIVDARNEINPDIVGWVTLDNTRIDYPFVRAEDNDYYLRRDIYEKYAYAGTVFMDYRCAKDFTDFVTILYGHNMKNGSMFADIRSYANAEFFDANDSGFLYLENAAYRLEVFAYMTVRGDDAALYAVGATGEPLKQGFLDYIRQNAQKYRELTLLTSDRFIVLSTCTSASKELRRVVIARLVEI